VFITSFFLKLKIEEGSKGTWATSCDSTFLAGRRMPVTHMAQRAKKGTCITPEIPSCFINLNNMKISR
jgi:hypothetical protein